MKPITLLSGEIYYKKIIVNSNAKTEDMRHFAKWSNNKGINAIVFNGYGGSSVKVYKIGSPIETHKTKGKKFNELLFYIYKKLNLNEKPLIIIGRRKVDRGLGFHYCPRTNDKITIDGSMGSLITNNREGLIWTDEILGRIDNKDIAVQKAGRLAGIIGNSPQYPKNIHYWTDEYTEKLIRKHNTIVDYTNNNSGCSISQAVKEAEKNVKHLNTIVNDTTIKEPVIKKFKTHEEVTKYYNNYLKDKLGGRGRGPKKLERNDNGFYETQIRGNKRVYSCNEIYKERKCNIENGAGYGYRPCYTNTENKDTLELWLIYYEK
jgi:hypothetical protein